MSVKPDFVDRKPPMFINSPDGTCMAYYCLTWKHGLRAGQHMYEGRVSPAQLYSFWTLTTEDAERLAPDKEHGGVL